MTTASYEMLVHANKQLSDALKVETAAARFFLDDLTPWRRT